MDEWLARLEAGRVGPFEPRTEGGRINLAVEEVGVLDEVGWKPKRLRVVGPGLVSDAETDWREACCTAKSQSGSGSRAREPSRGRTRTHRASDSGCGRSGRLDKRHTVLLLLFEVKLSALQLGREGVDALLERRLLLGDLGRRGGVSGLNLELCRHILSQPVQ